MKVSKYICFTLFLGLLSCGQDNSFRGYEPPRDEAEVYTENIDQIESYLKTHFYSIKEDGSHSNFKRVVFDTLSGDNANKTPLIEQDNLKKKVVTQNDVEYTVYYLMVEKGNEEEYKPTFADKVALTYRVESLEGGALLRDNRTPVVVDLPQSNEEFATTKGVIAALTEFHGGTDFTENPDGTIDYDGDFGIGAVFVPSGLAFFNNPPMTTLLMPYEPFVLSFNLVKAIQMDHDGDGIPSYMEDLNDNGVLDDDDTDKNGVPNYLDADDDGDGTPTRKEIIIHDTNKDWLTPDDIEFPDTDNSGRPDYLDPNVK